MRNKEPFKEAEENLINGFGLMGQTFWARENKNAHGKETVPFDSLENLQPHEEALPSAPRVGVGVVGRGGAGRGRAGAPPPEVSVRLVAGPVEGAASIPAP